jgi:hypothetical protein
MSRVDEAINSGIAIDANGMKVTLESCIFDMNDDNSVLTNN